MILVAAHGLALLVSVSAQAMASPNYKLEWFVPLTGSGGTASSIHYAIQYTVGQTATGNASSSHLATGLGFWAGIWNWLVHLPLIVR